DEPIPAKVSAEGNIWNVLEFENNEFNVSANSMSVVEVEVSPEEENTPGTYSGNIVVEAEKEKKTVPVRIAVELAPQPLFDLSFNILSASDLTAGKEFKTAITLVNIGRPGRAENITLNYSWRNTDNDNISFAADEETFAVKSTSTFEKNIILPDNLITGKYALDIKARYWNNRKNASASGTFNIIPARPPVILIFALAFVLAMLTIALLLYPRLFSSSTKEDYV
ncbi:MAG: hypothetical protein V1660_02895, partial [archaeon]